MKKIADERKRGTEQEGKGLRSAGGTKESHEYKRLTQKTNGVDTGKRRDKGRAEKTKGKDEGKRRTEKTNGQYERKP